MRVYEEAFIDHFRLYSEEELDSFQRPGRSTRRVLKQKLLAQYGAHCFECETPLDEKNFSMDHVVAEANHGNWVATNLQPLCKVCNERKADGPVATVRIALDMLLRPAPSDGYEDPVW